MINPNGSNVPEARNFLKEILLGQRGYIDSEAKQAIQDALDLMTRQKPIKVARKQQKTKITPLMKAHIRALAQDLSMSNADIAEKVGLPKCASGRVTEVLQGLR